MEFINVLRFKATFSKKTIKQCIYLMKSLKSEFALSNTNKKR